jgi:hypothetical protein
VKSNNAQIISANDLLEGDVVYLTAAGGWTRVLSDADLIEDKERAAVLLAGAKAQSGKVIDPYLLDVTTGPSGVRPAHIRERLRDSGPSFRADLQRAPLLPAG